MRKDWAITSLDGFEPREVRFRGVHSPEAITAAQMKAADKQAIEEYGIPPVVLMENAALATLREVENYNSFAIVCGTGNNGGDGLALARHLCFIGRDVRVFLIGDESKSKPEYKTNLNILSKIAPEVIHRIDENSFAEFDAAVRGCEACIDAIFGIGLTRPVTGLTRHVIKTINQLAFHIVSLDVPSGLNPDTGEEMGIAIRAHQTVTFYRMKKGLDIAPEFSGDVVVSYIGY